MCIFLDTKLRKGLSEKVNLKIKGRGISLVESGRKNSPKRSGTCEIPEVKKKVEISRRPLQRTQLPQGGERVQDESGEAGYITRALRAMFKCFIFSAVKNHRRG